jgi:glycerol-3-phosphate dehydrogenase (NAD(P)+)
MSVQEATNATESVVEGIATCKSVKELAVQCSVEMPITEAVYGILFKNKPVHEAISELMTRQLKSE